MGALGCGFSILAAVFAIIGTLPLLGWINWISTLPAAFLAILFSFVALSKNRQQTLAVLGLVVGVFILIWAAFRLAIGGGIL